MPVIDKSLDDILAGADSCEVVLRKRRQSEHDSFVEDIRTILEKECETLAREAERKYEAESKHDDDDDDDDAAPARGGGRDEAKHCESKEASREDSDDDAGDADDASSGWSDEDSDEAGDVEISATSGISANLLALLGQSAAPKAEAKGEPRPSKLKDGIFQKTWVPPRTSGLGNSASLLTGV